MPNQLNSIPIKRIKKRGGGDLGGNVGGSIPIKCTKGDDFGDEVACRRQPPEVPRHEPAHEEHAYRLLAERDPVTVNVFLKFLRGTRTPSLGVLVLVVSSFAR